METRLKSVSMPEVVLKTELSTLETLYKFYFLNYLNSFLKNEKDILYSINSRGGYVVHPLDKETFLSIFDDKGNVTQREKLSDSRLESELKILNEKQKLKLSEKDGFILDGLGFEIGSKINFMDKNSIIKQKQSYAIDSNSENLKLEAGRLNKYLTQDFAGNLLGEILRKVPNKEDTSHLFKGLKVSDELKTAVAEKLKESQMEIDELIKIGVLKKSLNPFNRNFILVESPKEVFFELNKQIKNFEDLLIKKEKNKNSFNAKSSNFFLDELNKIEFILSEDVLKQSQQNKSRSKIMQGEAIHLAKDITNFLNRLNSRDGNYKTLFLNAVIELSSLKTKDKNLQNILTDTTNKFINQQFALIYDQLSSISNPNIHTEVSNVLFQASSGLNSQTMSQEKIVTVIIALGYWLEKQDIQNALRICNILEKIAKEDPNHPLTESLKNFNEKVLLENSRNLFTQKIAEQQLYQPKYEENLLFKLKNETDHLILLDPVKASQLLFSTVNFLADPNYINTHSFRKALNNTKQISPDVYNIFSDLAITNLDPNKSINSEAWKKLGERNDNEVDAIKENLLSKKAIFIRKFEEAITKKENIFDIFIATKIAEELAANNIPPKIDVLDFASDISNPELRKAATDLKYFINYDKQRDQLKESLKTVSDTQKQLDQLKEEEKNKLASISNPLILEIEEQDEKSFKREVKKEFAIKKLSLEVRIASTNQAQKIINETDKLALQDKPSVELKDLTKVLYETNVLFTRKSYLADRFSILADAVSKIPAGKKLAGTMIAFFGTLIIGSSIALAAVSLGSLAPVAAAGISLGTSVIATGLSIATGVTATVGSTFGMSYLFKKPDLKRTMQELARMKENEQYYRKSKKEEERTSSSESSDEEAHKPKNGSKH